MPNLSNYVTHESIQASELSYHHLARMCESPMANKGKCCEIFKKFYCLLIMPKHEPKAHPCGSRALAHHSPMMATPPVNTTPR